MKLHIEQMLKRQKRHVSFHTPGHKRAGADITELSYSDNLLSPHGVLKQAEEDIAAILGAEKSFILTDGSTAGIHAMLYALKLLGKNKIAYGFYSHRSVKEGCKMLSLTAIEIPSKRVNGVPMQPSLEDMETALKEADALLITSPDYYGNFPPLESVRALCNRENKLLLIDGAHGAHLHYEHNFAGRYADFWTDGVHKSLPALTQGAVVSAKRYGDILQKAVIAVRTTSPSYPIMASVEYAIKYPRNLKIERAALALKKELSAYQNEDWSKLLIPFGDRADEAEKYLEQRGVYSEFNDGNYLMFYLSPCTKMRELKKLSRLVKRLPRGELCEEEERFSSGGSRVVFMPLKEAVGKICAEECGLFPPSLPLIKAGEVVTVEKAKRLSKGNTYGLTDGKILVYSEEV